MKHGATGMACVAAVIGSAAGAFAQGQPTYTPRLGFAAGWVAPAVPISAFEVFAPGVYEFTVLGGIFEAMGFEQGPGIECGGHFPQNFGVANWVGELASTEGMLDVRRLMGQARGRVPPYNFGPLVGEGTVMPTVIDGIDAARGSAFVVWPFGEPEAPLPPSFGVEEFARLYRFQIEIGDVSTPRDIVLTATGTMVAINCWGVLDQTPPMNGMDGETLWAPIPVRGGPRVAEAGELVIRVVPGPGGVGLLGLWIGIVAAARRR